MGGLETGYKTPETTRPSPEAHPYRHTRGSRHDLSGKLEPGCGAFLPSCWSCRRVDLEQRARYPWLTPAGDAPIDATDSLFDGGASGHDSRLSMARLLDNSKDAPPFPAQIEPTTLDPEDSPVRQPALPIAESCLAADESETQASTSDQRAAFAATLDAGQSSSHVPHRRSVPERRAARKQTLDLGSSLFARPSEDSKFSLLYGANSKQRTAAKSMKLIVRHDRKQTWPCPAPAFESSTLYMTRRKNKYPNYEIQIQRAKPNTLVRNSASTRWESEMKRTEVNFRQSLSLELLGKLVCGQGMNHEVRNNIDAQGEHLGQKLAGEEYLGQSVQLYNGLDGNSDQPGGLHSLLAAMELGVAVACNRYDRMLPHDEVLPPLGQRKAILRTRSEEPATFSLGDDEVSQAPVACRAPHDTTQIPEFHRVRKQMASALATRGSSHVWADE